MGQDKDSSTNEAKMCTQAKRGVFLKIGFPLADRCPAIFWKANLTVVWEDKHHNQKHSCFLLPSLGFSC